uniref:Claudin n=1 Tax=Arion vulgaris TaxID=1028688 RepID=A0A0B6ZG77_9EUPU
MLGTCERLQADDGSAQTAGKNSQTRKFENTPADINLRMGYGTGQRVAFAGLVIGFLLCTTGCIAPYWQTGSVNINKLASIVGESLPVIGEFDLAGMNGGLWWYCWDVLGEKECKAYDEPDTGDWIIRIVSAVNVLLTLICSLAALCRTCCCAGGKTIFHGIMTFIAGGTGIAAVGLFAGTVSEGFAMKVKLLEYGWAFYVYVAGAVIVTMVSFMLCFASPDNPLTPMIINSMGHILPNGRYARMADDRLPLEQTDTDVHVNLRYPQVQSY